MAISIVHMEGTSRLLLSDMQRLGGSQQGLRLTDTSDLLAVPDASEDVGRNIDDPLAVLNIRSPELYTA